MKKFYYQESRELDEAINQLALQICYTLKIDKICSWLEKQLNKLSK